MQTSAEAAERDGWPGDILTLADEEPERPRRVKLLWEAADALTRMRRFEAAKSVLEDLLALDPEHGDAQALLGQLPVRAGEAEAGPRFRKVLVFSGHMIDAPGRKEERFPARKEAAVRASIERQLDEWKVGAGDLAICGGARGGDLLFAEGCFERGAEVWLFLPLPEAEFLEESVRLPESDWEARYKALRDSEGVRVFSQVERLGSPPEDASVYARDNLWMINTARVEADDPKNLYAMLVWDEKPTGDGPGGTSDFAERIKRLGGQLAPVINPTKL